MNCVNSAKSYYEEFSVAFVVNIKYYSYLKGHRITVSSHRVKYTEYTNIVVNGQSQGSYTLKHIQIIFCFTLNVTAIFKYNFTLY